MLIRTLTLFFTFLYSTLTWSFSCYYTLVKDNCWTKYDVSVDVIDASLTKQLFTIKIPAGTTWARQEFSCETGQNLIYIARFSPVFWQGDEDKTYRGRKNWFLPSSINPTDTAWDISVCYPEDFAEVPLPPDAGSHCKCELSKVPKINP